MHSGELDSGSNMLMRSLVENTAIEDDMHLKAQELPVAFGNITGDLEGTTLDKESYLERNINRVFMHS